MRIAAGMIGVVLCLRSVLPLPAMAAAPSSGPVKTLLTTSYAVTVGDMIGIESSAVLNATKPIDIPMVVTYNSHDKWLEVDLFGGRGSVDGAKEVVEDFLKLGEPIIVSLAKRRGVEVVDTQVMISYLNRLDGYKRVLRRERGKYIVE